MDYRAIQYIICKIHHVQQRDSSPKSQIQPPFVGIKPLRFVILTWFSISLVAQIKLFSSLFYWVVGRTNSSYSKALHQKLELSAWENTICFRSLCAILVNWTFKLLLFPDLKQAERAVRYAMCFGVFLHLMTKEGCWPNLIPLTSQLSVTSVSWDSERDGTEKCIFVRWLQPETILKLSSSDQSHTFTGHSSLSPLHHLWILL